MSEEPQHNRFWNAADYPQFPQADLQDAPQYYTVFNELLRRNPPVARDESNLNSVVHDSRYWGSTSDRHDCTETLFNGSSEQGDEGLELKTDWVDSMWTGTWETGDKPAQESPEIDQEQSEAQHKEAKSWIA